MRGHIEPASSGRSKCVVCQGLIKKDEWRLVEVVDFTAVDAGTTNHFYHLRHAAERKPRELLIALNAFDGKVPEREELQATAEQKQTEINEFIESPEWERNDHGNLALKGSRPTIRVFHTEGKGFNWVVGKTFGKGFLDSEEDAKRDLWLFLQAGE